MSYEISTSGQYGVPCIKIDQPGPSAEEVITACRDHGAVFYEDGPDDECFVVDIGRGVGPELYTERALRGSLK